LVDGEAAGSWLDLDELVATEDPRRAAHLLQSQLRLIELIDRTRSLTDFLAQMVHVLEDQIEELICAALLLSDDRLHLRVAAAPSMPEYYRRALDGVPVGPSGGWAALTAFSKQPVIVEDIERDPRWIDVKEPALAAGFRACWSLPVLTTSGDLLGALSMYHPRPRSPSAIELRLLAFATVLARIALERDREGPPRDDQPLVDARARHDLHGGARAPATLARWRVALSERLLGTRWMLGAGRVGEQCLGGVAVERFVSEMTVDDDDGTARGFARPDVDRRVGAQCLATGAKELHGMPHPEAQTALRADPREARALPDGARIADRERWMTVAGGGSRRASSAAAR
jgi:hypothetical protein